MGMKINEETAQLILDAISWCNRDWVESLGWGGMDTLITDRGDFVRFCHDRGIETIERTVHVKGPVKGWVDNED